MHVTMEEMTAEKMKPERDKINNKLSLNIPIYGKNNKNEISEKNHKKGVKNSLLGHKQAFDLEAPFRKLCISTYRDDDLSDSDSSSSDEERRKKLEDDLVPKCPDRSNCIKKEHLRSQTRPYNRVLQNVSHGLQSGGTIIPPPLTDIEYQIPTPVEEFETQNELTEYLSDIMPTLNNTQIQKLYNAIDILQDQCEKEVKIGTPINQNPRIRDSDVCNSPDSSYGTMSPASIPPSPFSMHSPNPRGEKVVSESDSAGECELGLTELSFGPIEITRPPNFQMVSCTYIGPPPRSTPNISPRAIYATPQTMPTLLPRPLRPDSIEVNEVGLDKSAMARLREKKMIKDSILGIEWVAAIEEAKPVLNTKNSNSLDIQDKKKHLRRKLINLILEGPKKRHFYEELYSKVKLYMKDVLIDILAGKDEKGQTPLFVAATTRTDVPLVPRLIADSLVQGPNKQPNEAIDGEDNTLLHFLAGKGDSHAQVLCELLYSKVFNVNHKNAGSQTALHKAVETHVKVSSLASIKQLVKHGAQIKLQDLYGRTVLHLAVLYPQSDPQVLRALLMSTAEDAVNILDNDRNTPLHIAAQRNDLSLDKQKEFINLLMLSKARHDIRNKDEKVALALVNQERKEDMKNVIHRKM